MGGRARILAARLLSKLKLKITSKNCHSERR
jgi:hypothetical protein